MRNGNLRRIARLGLAAALLATAAPALAEGVLGDVVTSAAPLARLTPDSMEGRRWDDVGSMVEAEKNCQKQVDRALATGMKLDQEFEMQQLGPLEKMPRTRFKALDNTFGSGDQNHYWSNLGLIRDFCKQKLAMVQLLRADLTLEEAYSQFVELKNNGASTAYRVRFAEARSRACTREIKATLDAKVDPKTPMLLELEQDQTGGSDRIAVKVGEAQAKVCGPLAEQVEVVRQRWKKQGNWSAFAALPGDRKKVFDEQALWLEESFSSGKTPLQQLDDFKYADTWYVVLLDRSQWGGKAWIVHSFRFEKDKLVETKELHGDDDPGGEIFK